MELEGPWPYPQAECSLAVSVEDPSPAVCMTAEDLVWEDTVEVTLQECTVFQATQVAQLLVGTVRVRMILASLSEVSVTVVGKARVGAGQALHLEASVISVRQEATVLPAAAALGVAMALHPAMVFRQEVMPGTVVHALLEVAAV